jgi:hypothetical protein
MKRLGGKFGVALCSALLAAQIGCLGPGGHGLPRLPHPPGLPRLPGLPSLPGPANAGLANLSTGHTEPSTDENLVAGGETQTARMRETIACAGMKRLLIQMDFQTE